MDVEKEIAAANHRIQAQINANARAALIRIGIDVEGEERAAREALEAERRRAAAEAGEALGRALRRIHDSLVRGAEAIARGFNGGAR